MAKKKSGKKAKPAKGAKAKKAGAARKAGAGKNNAKLAKASAKKAKQAVAAKKEIGKPKHADAAERSVQAEGMAIECPNCGKQAEAREITEDVPNFGKVAISTLLCSKCNFKLNDVVALDQKPPAIYQVEVKSPKDLETKLVKSSTGTVRIDKLGICIEPGPAAEGYITNIEGLLDRIEQATKVLLDSKDNDEADERKLARKEMERVKGARMPESSYVVVVEDPFGNSALIGENVEKVKLSDGELKRLQERVKELESGIEPEI